MTEADSGWYLVSKHSEADVVAPARSKNDY